MGDKLKYFSAATVRRMQEGMRAALSLPPEDEVEIPEGLSKSPIDPTRVVERLQAVRLKPGLVLRGYQFYSGGNGNGFVLAMPKDAPFPEPDECPYEEVEVVPGVFLDRPRPSGALEHFMDAFEGDGSALSFLEASILFRELSEFGAMWHGCDWSTHIVLDSNPFQVDVPGLKELESEMLSDSEHWEWEQSEPEDWRPKVCVTEEHEARVEFITFSGLGRATLYKHVDTFLSGCLKPESQRMVLATGPGGYVF